MNSIERDILAVERASAVIVEMGAELDAQLAQEPRASEQLRLVREATNRITRTANDAIQAYRRARRAIDLRETPASAGDPGERLGEARDAMLSALDAAGRRYPWAPGSRDPSP